MTWIKLDDRAPRHPKVAGLSDRAFRTWVQAMCYASEFLTDGVVPVAFLNGVPTKVRGELVTAGLWLIRDEQMVIHDYLAHQTGKADVERERERSRQRRAGKRPMVDQRSTDGRPSEDRDQSTENREQRRDHKEHSTAPPALHSVKAPSNWKRAIAIAHKAIETYEHSMADQADFFKAECGRQGIDYGERKDGRPLYARALDYVESVRARRVS